jgi:acyl-CoA thioesterase-1
MQTVINQTLHNYRRGKNALGILLLLFIFLLSACSSGQTKISVKPAETSQVQITQPVTSQQLRTHPDVYVAMGASDAIGIGTTNPKTQGYVPQIEAHLPQGSRLVNLGVSSIQLHAAMLQELPLALATQPDLITIWLVANDFVAGVPYDSYMQDLNTTLQQLRSGTKARIVMANLPDLTLLPMYAKVTSEKKSQIRQQIQLWNTQIAKLAQKYNVTLVDLYKDDSQLTSHPGYVSSDGFHPSAAGYTQLANYFWDAINGPN